MTHGNDTINVMYDEPNVHERNGGLTKREYFAAMVMQGFISSFTDQRPIPERVAEFSVICADALITELNKQP